MKKWLPKSKWSKQSLREGAVNHNLEKMEILDLLKSSVSPAEVGREVSRKGISAIKRKKLNSQKC